MPNTPSTTTYDAHRHLGRLPAYPFYGGPPVNPDTTARDQIADLLADLDREGTARALLLPNYGVPDPSISFGHNDLVLEACGKDDRLLGALWTSPLERDAELTEQALALTGETGIVALKLSFLLGGAVDDPSCRAGLERIFATARERDLVVHVHTSPGAASTASTSSGKAGLSRWRSKPAARERARSSSVPQPVSATSMTPSSAGSWRRRRAAS